MIHGYGSKADQPWINMDQRGSSVLQPAVIAHASEKTCTRKAVFGYISFWLMRSACPPWLMRPTSHVMAHVSCVMAHVSCVMCHESWLMRHASWLMAHASWLMRHASWLMRSACPPWLMRHASWLMRHGSWLMRPTLQPHSAPFSRRPLSVMTTTRRRQSIHATAPRFAPVELYDTGQ